MAVTMYKLGDERKRNHSLPLRALEYSVGDGHVKEHQDRQWEQEAWGSMTEHEQVH